MIPLVHHLCLGWFLLQGGLTSCKILSKRQGSLCPTPRCQTFPSSSVRLLEKFQCLWVYYLKSLLAKGRGTQEYLHSCQVVYITQQLFSKWLKQIVKMTGVSKNLLYKLVPRAQGKPRSRLRKFTRSSQRHKTEHLEYSSQVRGPLLQVWI